MMPIVFCASFVPCMSPMPMALTIWALPKTAFTVRGFQLRSSAYSSPMMRNPSTKPDSGEANIGMMTFHSSPLLGYQCCGSGSDQMTTLQLPRRRDRGPDQSADQGMTRAAGQPGVPRDEIPDDGAEQCANQHFLRGDPRVDQSRGDRRRDGRAPQGADEIRARPPSRRLAAA